MHAHPTGAFAAFGESFFEAPRDIVVAGVHHHLVAGVHELQSGIDDQPLSAPDAEVGVYEGNLHSAPRAVSLCWRTRASTRFSGDPETACIFGVPTIEIWRALPQFAWRHRTRSRADMPPKIKLVAKSDAEIALEKKYELLRKQRAGVAAGPRLLLFPPRVDPFAPGRWPSGWTRF